MRKLLPVAAFVILSGHATAGQAGNRPKAISYKEAAAFELALLAREKPPLSAPAKLYVQPSNKTEPCKLPTTQEQLNRPNFRAYWDGECRNGFAYGLGRDIALSDTHHLEEITIHDGTDTSASRPSVGYDFVNNMVIYVVSGSKYPVQTSFKETMVDSVSGYNAYQTLTVIDEQGKVSVVQSSAFQPLRIYMSTRTDRDISYKFTDNSAAPVINQTAPVFVTEIIDTRNNTPGIAVVRFPNGLVQHLKISEGKRELVSLPTAYTAQLSAKYQEIASAASGANASLQRAQQIEREYLFKACNGKSSIAGLDNATYTKICTWRDQFKAPYAVASANYQRQLESWKQQAATADQQRQIQQQIAIQQQMLQQQQNQQAWNEINQANQRLQQQTQQIMQGVNSWQAPQVQPITPSGGDKVICNTIGSITTCR